MQTFLVTGGAGFIGANFILQARAADWASIINMDKLTYASNLQNLAALKADPNYHFVQGDIGNAELVRYLLAQYQPDALVNFAAETHVDRSIVNPSSFIQTNAIATFQLLETTKTYWQNLSTSKQGTFRFLQVSTDEVYGSLGPDDPAFTEKTAYAPNNPYAASKAASDHVVRAYHHTYGFPTLTTNCSNNYGPYQFPEKLIPLAILNALAGESLPIYGDGQNIRDWLYVVDHCEAIYQVLTQGKVGETYNIGGNGQRTNLAVVEQICAILDQLVPQPGFHRSALITFVKDRPGHDRRYAIDSYKIQQELGWYPQESFETGIKKTVHWYLDHPNWMKQVQSQTDRDWIHENYKNR